MALGQSVEDLAATTVWLLSMVGFLLRTEASLVGSF
jgi:hypothetical protein